MKNKIIKIFIIAIMLILTIHIKSNAASFNISTNEKEISVNNELIVNINTDKNIETATFYLKYDNTKLEYIESLNKNVSSKDYPEEGTLRVVYLDTTFQGEKQLSFKFKTKENVKDETKLSITNLTLQFVNDSKVYTNSNLEQSSFDTAIKITQENVNEKEIRNIILAIGLIIIIVIILVGFVNIKKKKQNK